MAGRHHVLDEVEVRSACFALGVRGRNRVRVGARARAGAGVRNRVTAPLHDEDSEVLQRLLVRVWG